ncbi:MAG: anthranilate synthase/aminodeoxychorismate synthase-like glutamine amidotransferase [Gammaproteobacteria bacterium]|jgi:anthranilate synthase/aminodeoxychorismate synthase-like glutamine amidotransferase|tara:strand:+ start:540 stop:1115 length:576 start_codon:yes stop_codon:yes gene_type:complete
MSKSKLLLIDNYDSFTYNLVQAFLVMDVEVLVYRNDQIAVAEALALNPTHLCISPGPGRPDGAGISLAMIAAFEGKVPVLGVCLGHQSMVQHFGGEIISAARLMHGKTSLIGHDGKGLFAGLPQPLEVGRYHSLAVNRDTIPDCLEVTARTDGGEIMAVRHKTLPMESVQFHPESVLTPEGDALLANFFKS